MRRFSGFVLGVVTVVVLGAHPAMAKEKAGQMEDLVPVPEGMMAVVRVTCS